MSPGHSAGGRSVRAAISLGHSVCRPMSLELSVSERSVKHHNFIQVKCTEPVVLDDFKSTPFQKHEVGARAFPTPG
jgi:hypothetical protein